MNFISFRQKVAHLPIIMSKDLELFSANKQVIRNQLRRWVAKQLLVKLKRGIYLLNENDRKIPVNRYFIANQLYVPSYISLETALCFYGLIPETVSDVTSVTTRKPTRMSNTVGVFVYQHIKREGFTGFIMNKSEGDLSYFIAEPEKAVVDFLYLNSASFGSHDRERFEESYRFQNIEELDTEKLMSYAALFTSKKLLKITKRFCYFVDRERS